MSELDQMRSAYQEGGIWTMASDRASCVVPEQPLIIEAAEVDELHMLAKAIWYGFMALVGSERQTRRQGEWAMTREPSVGNDFPEGLTMPPALRADVVRTRHGPRIVEIDPISALSLGETAFLADVWANASYKVVGGLCEVIAQDVVRRGQDMLSITLPSRLRSSQRGEMTYLAKQLAMSGVRTSFRQKNDPETTLELSAFVEDADTRRQVEEDGFPGERNPLWGSLLPLASKANLALLDRSSVRLYLPREYTAEALKDLGDEQCVVCKPLQGTGSVGVCMLPAGEARQLRGQWIFQELLEPVSDDYGTCTNTSGETIAHQDWVTRLSIYATWQGIGGAQATAMPRTGSFTNAHGQRDAVQAAVAIK